MAGKRIAATLVEDVDKALGVPGAIELRSLPGETAVDGIAFNCPCGCGGLGWLPVDRDAGYGWTFDGNREKPTTNPSVLQRGCGWHGYLRAGVWEEC